MNVRQTMKNGREERIRTSDPSVPNAVLYQTEPLPDLYRYAIGQVSGCGGPQHD